MRAKATLRNKRSPFVMAGLVPVIHVVARHTLPDGLGMPARARRISGKYFTVHVLHHVDDRDKPGHDGLG